MTNRLTKPGRTFARIQLIVQCTITLLSAMACFIAWGWSTAVSAFAGGFVAIIPQSIFAYKAFKYAGATQSKKVIDAFYSGEKLKLLLSVVLIALVYRFIDIDVAPFLTSFSLAVVLPLLTPVFLNFNHWDK